MTQLVRVQSLATALILLTFCFGWCQISCHARTMPPASLHLCAQLMQTSLKSCLGRIIQAPITEGAWLRDRAPMKKGGSGVRDPVLRSPAAYLAPSSSTSSLCKSLWSEFKDTHDPNVTAAEAHFRPQRLGGCGMAPRGTCPTCVTHKLWTYWWKVQSRRPNLPRITPGRGRCQL